MDAMSGFIFEIAHRKKDSRSNNLFRFFVVIVASLEKANSQMSGRERSRQCQRFCTYFRICMLHHCPEFIQGFIFKKPWHMSHESTSKTRLGYLLVLPASLGYSM